MQDDMPSVEVTRSIYSEKNLKAGNFKSNMSNLMESLLQQVDAVPSKLARKKK